MLNKNYYLMFPALKFAFVRFQSNTLTIEEAERINCEYKADKDYSKIEKLLVIIDENCIPQFSSKDIQRIADLYNNPLQENNHKTIVWLVAAPLVTAFTQLFILKSKDNSLYCSTTQKAYELLGMHLSFEEFNLLLTQL